MLHLGASGSFVANRIQLNTNVSKVTVEDGFIADTLVYVRFPPGNFPAAYNNVINSNIWCFVLVSDSQ